MRSLLRTTTLLAFIVFGAVRAADAQVSFDIRIGPPPPPVVVHAYPPRPAPGYMWVDGYWYPVGNHYKWRKGYWARPPYSGARWVGPQYRASHFYYGYWDGRHGRYDERGHKHHGNGHHK